MVARLPASIPEICWAIERDYGEAAKSALPMMQTICLTPTVSSVRVVDADGATIITEVRA